MPQGCWEDPVWWFMQSPSLGTSPGKDSVDICSLYTPLCFQEGNWGPEELNSLRLDPVIPAAGPELPSAVLAVMAGPVVTCCCWPAAALSPCTFLLPWASLLPHLHGGRWHRSPCQQVFWGQGHGGAGMPGKRGMRAKCTVPISLPSRYAHPPVSFSSFVKIRKIPASDLKNFLALMGIWLYQILVHFQRGEKQGNGEGIEMSACHFFSVYSRPQTLLSWNKSGKRETHRLWKPLTDVSGCSTSISDSPCRWGLWEPGWGETRNRRDSAAPRASLSQVPRRLSQQGSNPQCSWTKVLQTSLLSLLWVNTRP